MQAQYEREMQETLNRVEAVFIPGRLADRRDEMLRLRKSGETMFFTGKVRWSIFLTDYDKSIKGDSESLNTAFADMANYLEFLAPDHGNDTEIVCSIETAPETQLH